MQHAVELLDRTRAEITGGRPLHGHREGIEVAHHIQRHLDIPVDPTEIAQVGYTAMPRLLHEMRAGGPIDLRRLYAWAWNHGAMAGLLAAPRRYKNHANSGMAPASGDFWRLNVSATAAIGAQLSSAVLNAADITARLSHSLYTARNEAGLSQERLAGDTGVRPDQIGRWENGRVRISERTLLRFMNFFPYDISWWYASHHNGDGT